TYIPAGPRSASQDREGRKRSASRRPRSMYYFLRMPMSVLPKFFMARSAAGVSTALSWEVGAGLTEEASTSPVAAWLSALPTLAPEEPPVPLMVCPVDKVLPA